MTNEEKVREFHTFYNVPAPVVPSIPNEDRVKLRKQLIEEEYGEFERALEAEDLVEASDAIADLLYVVYGTGIEFGLPVDALFAEVHKSNMSKLNINNMPDYNEFGKVLKGPNFVAPDIKGVLGL